jgi:hypothetical protein
MGRGAVPVLRFHGHGLATPDVSANPGRRFKDHELVGAVQPMNLRSALDTFLSGMVPSCPLHLLRAAGRGWVRLLGRPSLTACDCFA